MNNLMKSFSLATVLSLASVSVMAGEHYRDHDNYSDHHGHYQQERARVVHVEPIYRYVEVRTPERECWSEPRRVSRNDSYTSTIAGGIIGGVIGNQFGGGTGKTVLTVAGTLLGGSMGRDMGGQSVHHETHYEERCHVSEHYRQERVMDGYDVTYRYRGKLYNTHMDRHPGDSIAVDVDVRPRRYY